MRLWLVRSAVGLVLFALVVFGIFAAHWANGHNALWLTVLCGMCAAAALAAGVVVSTADGMPPAWRKRLLPDWLLPPSERGAPRG
ncbi:hypothetical protein [Actinacidiphila yeochonensis]|uniref:hypothetical protein n=1 Tax=Actinacidiphila yeochonensis TaxID=89050 RepID=UPI00056C2689|nr:hypothetical protein [Actinacidiphila yeochonensis]